MEDILKFDPMDTKIIGRSILCYEKLPSTNDEAKKMIDTAAEGTVLIADCQTMGKGRKGRQWSSGKKTDIAMSIILKPQLSLIKAAEVTLGAGIAVTEAIRNLTGIEAMIKWPNDVLASEKKICGILTESAAKKNQEQQLVVGIGVNVNDREFPQEIKEKATSIFLQCGIKYERTDVIRAILIQFDGIYQRFLAEGFSGLRHQYENLCYTIGKEVRVITDQVEITGTVLTITEDGALLIQKANGEQITVFTGEVSIRGMDHYV